MTTLDEIAALLDAAELNYERADGRIRTGFGTDVYEDADGDGCLHLVIGLQEDVELLRILAPMAYRLPPKTGPRRLAAIQSTLNQINWESRVVQYEMDTEDGEIRLAIDFPLEDGKLTELQLTRMLRLMPNVADQCHIGLRRALDEGIAMPTEAALRRELEKFVRALPEGDGNPPPTDAT
jgi:hypothetical protein